ncbi:hypothetical protein WJX77_010046 [Trebouxia sp. C0004]
MASRFIGLLANNHPCIFPPETSSFTAGRPCAERVKSRVAASFRDGFEKTNLYKTDIFLSPFAVSGLTARGNVLSRGSELHRRAVNNYSRVELQVVYTEDSRECLLATGKADNQKGRGSVVGMIRGAAKGFFQQIRVARPHNHFL